MDPIANMLISIKNGGKAEKESVFIPYSKMKYAILECLKKEGYVGSISKKTKKDLPVIEVELLYTDGKAKVLEVDRISKQSKRVYYGMRDIHTVRSGQGLLVLSTPKGILYGKDARREQVGGEALFKIW